MVKRRTTEEERLYKRDLRARQRATPPTHQAIPVLEDEVVPVPKSEVVREIKPKRGLVSRETPWIALMTQAERDAVLRRITKG